ncbi:uncharacterized mitochondrial protein AtMg00810-like [Rutidosis leptorrhynchoides]|uniref:uncharacterized mitochondrial protein AtMg00810-like n=1 Tax=Rutidosis leptorrhynchoides TaxID=125765 RepID=UPI003A98DAEF
MDPLSYFLGIEVNRNGHDTILSQRKYIHELLERAELSHSKLISYPMTTNVNHVLGDSETFNKPVKCHQVGGALRYVTLSRRDIKFAVKKVFQCMQSPTQNHWSAVTGIPRYLQGPADHGLRFMQDLGTILHAYTDSAYNSLNSFSDVNWEICIDDLQSMKGYVIYLGSNLVSWSARKQKH